MCVILAKCKIRHSLHEYDVFCCALQFQDKRKVGIIERVNYNIRTGKIRQPKAPIKKENAIMLALQHFNMV